MLSHVQHFCGSMNCSPPDSCVHEILQARILEWVAVHFSRGSSQPRDRTHISCTAGLLCTLWIVVQLMSCVWLCNSILPHARLPCPSLSPRVCSHSSPLSQWYYLTVSSYAATFSYCPQSFLASAYFPVSWLFTSGGQSIGAPASASTVPMNVQCCLPSVLTDLITPLSKQLSRVFSSTTI